MLLYLSGPSQIWLNWCFSTYQWLFTAVLLASGMHLQTAGWHPMQPHLDLPLQPQEHSQLQTYERNDFRGRMLEFRSDCPSLQENNCRDILSHHIPKERCVFFFFYEQPQFRRLQHLLQPGKYRQFSDWGTMTARVGSFQPTLDIS